MGVLKFSDCFWNVDFNSSSGFDILVKRMKDGRTCSKEIISFVKERSKVEEDYAKALGRLSRLPLGSTEAGTSKDILNILKADTEKAANLHLDMSQSLTEQAQRIQAVKDKFSQQCKQAEEVVRKLQTSKKDLYSKTQASQQTYQKKSAQYEAAQQSFLSEKSAGLKAPKDLEKLENKAHKCKEDKLRSNDAYQTMVKELESVRVKWEKEMEKACEVFEQVELERIIFFRNELWVHVNIESKTLFDQDEMNEEARLVMVKCDALQDIQDFIGSNQTGSQRPAPVLYESGESRAGSKTLRPQKPTPSGASTFFQQSSFPAAGDDSLDPTYASVAD